jgi:hypothetical protein
MGLVEEPDFHGYLRDGESLCKQGLSEARPYQRLICVWWESNRLTEDPAQVERTEARFLRQPFERYVLAGECFEVLPHPLHCSMFGAYPGRP